MTFNHATCRHVLCVFNRLIVLLKEGIDCYNAAFNKRFRDSRPVTTTFPRLVIVTVRILNPFNERLVLTSPTQACVRAPVMDIMFLARICFSAVCPKSTLIVSHCYSFDYPVSCRLHRRSLHVFNQGPLDR